jgi:hypothetical protein
MIIVDTLIKIGDTFVPLSKWGGRPHDPEYIEGAIVIRDGKSELLNEEYWDDINYLWPYIANGFQKLVDGEDFVTGFPDQPMKLEIKRGSSGMMDLRVFSGGRTLSSLRTPARPFMLALVKAARAFFSTMNTVAPEVDIAFDHYMSIISSAETKIIGTGS